MKSATRRKSRKRGTVAFGPVSQIIARIPRPYPPSTEALGALITKELFDVLESILSKTEFSELRGSQSVSATSVEKLDALILRQAETMGWRLGLSPLVHLRFSEWDNQSNGPTLFERYGKALAKSARRFQKRELLPLDDPDLYRHKLETVPKLRLLLHNMRNKFSKTRVRPSEDDLIEYFKKNVSAEGDAFYPPEGKQRFLGTILPRRFDENQTALAWETGRPCGPL